MSSIRITYSGLIGLVVRLSSLITGMMFSIIITRNLVPEEFGLYALIGSLIAYAMFGHVISAFWIPRHIPRGEEVGKTALLTSGIFSLVGMLAYLIAAYFVAQNTNSDFNILLLGSLLIPATYIANTLDSINQGFRPQAVSYSFISFEVAKVPLGYLLLEPFTLGLAGAIIATLIALLIKSCTAIFFTLPRLKSAIDISFLKRWLKLSWLSLYGIFAGNIYVLDTFIVAIFFSSTESLSYSCNHNFYNSWTCWNSSKSIRTKINCRCKNTSCSNCDAPIQLDRDSSSYSCHCFCQTIVILTKPCICHCCTCNLFYES